MAKEFLSYLERQAKTAERVALTSKNFHEKTLKQQIAAEDAWGVEGLSEEECEAAGEAFDKARNEQKTAYLIWNSAEAHAKYKSELFRLMSSLDPERLLSLAMCARAIEHATSELEED